MSNCLAVEKEKRLFERRLDKFFNLLKTTNLHQIFLNLFYPLICYRYLFLLFKKKNNPKKVF